MEEPPPPGRPLTHSTAPRLTTTTIMMTTTMALIADLARVKGSRMSDSGTVTPRTYPVVGTEFQATNHLLPPELLVICFASVSAQLVTPLAMH